MEQSKKVLELTIHKELILEGLEQNQSAPVQQRANKQPQAVDLGQSVSAVRDIMSQSNGGGEAIQFVTERLNEIVSYIKSNQNPDEMSGPAFEHLKQFKAQLHGAGIEAKYAEELIEQTKARLRLNQLDKQYIFGSPWTGLGTQSKVHQPLGPATWGSKECTCLCRSHRRG